MTQLRMLVATALLGLLAVSCAGPTQLVESWADPAYTGQSAKKIMVVGLAESQRRVTVFEDIMAGYFTARKLEVLRGATVVANSKGDLETFKEGIRQSGADLVSITRLLGVADETVYVPGSTSYVPVSGYYGMGPYYSSAYAMVQDPGYVTTYKVYKVETNVYDVKTEKLIWSGLSETTDPANFDDAVNSIGAAVVGDLVQRKIIP